MGSKRVGNNKRISNLSIQLVLLLITLLFLYSLITNYHHQRSNHYRLIIIKQGDTLWNIANQYKDKKTDIRKFVLLIKKENDLIDSDIFPGQELRIPLPKEKRQAFAQK